MVTVLKVGGQNTSRILDLCGLSEDEKPIGTINGFQILNGSTFLEMDTATVFMYSDSDETWYQVT